MKVLLISGHGAGDVGACGNGYKEYELTREVVNILAPKLRKYATVDVYNQNRNAYNDVCKGKIDTDFANYDYVFEVHFNAFNRSAKGTEIYVTSKEKVTIVEQKVMEKLSKFFNVRGVKIKDFAVINSAKKRGISSALIEICFIDNVDDINIYQKNKDDICSVICEGIVEGFGLEKISDAPKVSDLQCNAHIQDIGWTGYKNTKEGIIGTEGQGKRLEAIQFKANNGLEIKYRVHIENIGWQDWRRNGEVAGTEGQALKIEAIEIESNKDLEVQEHIQDVGWMPSSKGKFIHIGTEGKCLRLEAFKIRVI